MNQTAEGIKIELEKRLSVRERVTDRITRTDNERSHNRVATFEDIQLIEHIENKENQDVEGFIQKQQERQLALLDNFAEHLVLLETQRPEVIQRVTEILTDIQKVKLEYDALRDLVNDDPSSEMGQKLIDTYHPGRDDNPNIALRFALQSATRPLVESRIEYVDELVEYLTQQWMRAESDPDSDPKEVEALLSLLTFTVNTYSGQKASAINAARSVQSSGLRSFIRGVRRSEKSDFEKLPASTRLSALYELIPLRDEVEGEGANLYAGFAQTEVMTRIFENVQPAEIQQEHTEAAKHRIATKPVMEGFTPGSRVQFTDDPVLNDVIYNNNYPDNDNEVDLSLRDDELAKFPEAIDKFEGSQLYSFIEGELLVVGELFSKMSELQEILNSEEKLMVYTQESGQDKYDLLRIQNELRKKADKAMRALMDELIKAWKKADSIISFGRREVSAAVIATAIVKIGSILGRNYGNTLYIRADDLGAPKLSKFLDQRILSRGSLRGLDKTKANAAIDSSLAQVAHLQRVFRFTSSESRT